MCIRADREFLDSGIARALHDRRGRVDFVDTAQACGVDLQRDVVLCREFEYVPHLFSREFADGFTIKAIAVFLVDIKVPERIKEPAFDQAFDGIIVFLEQRLSAAVFEILYILFGTVDTDMVEAVNTAEHEVKIDSVYDLIETWLNPVKITDLDPAFHEQALSTVGFGDPVDRILQCSDPVTGYRDHGSIPAYEVIVALWIEFAMIGETDLR
jgi:hypothetical protein